MAGEAVSMRYADGQQIHARGEKKPNFSMIRKGRVRLGAFSGHGNFVEFGVLRAGDVYGEMTVISGIARIHDSYAVGATVIDHLSAERFRALLDEYPALQRQMLRLMARRLQHSYQRIDDILRLPLIDRVGRYLLDTKRRITRSQSLQLKQSDIAEAMAASRVSISKAMAQLSELGFVTTGYGSIHLDDVAGLTQWLEDRYAIAPPVK